MNEENKIGYYAIIPSTVLFNEKLKSNEKLLYAVITVLSNQKGYCFASNSYLGKLLNVKPHTISVWISELKSMGFLQVDIIRDDKGEVIQRNIYPNDTPYVINKTYPYVIDKIEGMSQKRQYNNIRDNNKIDRLFNYIINKEEEIPTEFKNVEKSEIMNALKRYDMYYPKEITENMSDENLEKVKDITYTIAQIVKNNLFYLTNKVSRDKLIQLYNSCKKRQEENQNIDNFTNYYYKSVENELTKDVEPSFFTPKNNEISDIEIEM